jgi:hypothetical protein
MSRESTTAASHSQLLAQRGRSNRARDAVCYVVSAINGAEGELFSDFDGESGFDERAAARVVARRPGIPIGKCRLRRPRS